jgi:hypothetical protein
MFPVSSRRGQKTINFQAAPRGWHGHVALSSGQTHQMPRGFTGQIGKPKIQIPNPKQIPRSQIPKPGIGSRVGTGSFEFIWVWDFGFWNFAHGMENS